MPRQTKTATSAGATLPSVPHERVDPFVTRPMSAEAARQMRHLNSLDCCSSSEAMACSALSQGAMRRNTT